MPTSDLYMHICAPAYVCKHTYCLSHFSVVTQYQQKQFKEGFTVSQFKVQPIMVVKLRKKEQLVTLRLQLRWRKQWMMYTFNFPFLYSQDSSQEWWYNLQWVASYFNELNIVSYKHFQMPTSQVIPDHVKLITETYHMHTGKKNCIYFIPVLLFEITFKMHQKMVAIPPCLSFLTHTWTHQNM